MAANKSSLGVGEPRAQLAASRSRPGAQLEQAARARHVRSRDGMRANWPADAASKREGRQPRRQRNLGPMDAHALSRPHARTEGRSGV